MLFAVLGPLRVSAPDGAVALPGGRGTAAVCWLVLHADRPVGVTWLAGRLWPGGGTDATVRARAVLRGLAPVLGDRCLPVDDRVQLVGADDEVDARRFEQLVDRARDHRRRGDAARAGACLDEALALWRSEPYPELDRDVEAIGAVERLLELHLTAVEESTSLALDGSVDYALVADLQAWVVRHPERPRLRRQLAVALYRTGRQVEALAATAASIRDLGDADGASGVLRAAILRHDDRLAGGEPLVP